jgi:DNA replication initiation complex subunit (GINS family)
LCIFAKIYERWLFQKRHEKIIHRAILQGKKHGAKVLVNRQEGKCFLVKFAEAPI